MIGDPANFELPGLVPMIIELGVLVAPRNAGAAGDETDAFAVFFQSLEIQALAAVAAGLMFADVDAKCSAHASSWFEKPVVKKRSKDSSEIQLQLLCQRWLS
jgi:hypothetical protein